MKPEAEEKASFVGLVAKAPYGWALLPTNRRDRNTYFCKNPSLAETMEGRLVLAHTTGATKQKRVEAIIESDLADGADPKAISLISLSANDISMVFPESALREAEEARPVPLGEREDLRKIPLVTIDGEDARDFDDAVFAEKTKEGFHLIVAIADVSYYVRPESALDREAYRRGNSTYLPDCVVPMLPEALSNELCSLKPKVDRACLAVHIHIDQHGEITKHRFTRALMRSHARLTYPQVQAALEGKPDKTTKPLLDTVIHPLEAAFHCLLAARGKRGTLELDLPERKIVLDADGNVARIELRRQMDSHRLIEEFMITANVAAAVELEGKGGACLYRIHDKPSEIKLAVLREFLEGFDISLAAGKDIRPGALTHILEKTAGSPYSRVINEMMLRTQSQAIYSPDNIGHFGLALARYAHFTSPIRRYADLVVHRGLVSKLNLGEGGLTEEEKKSLSRIADHISTTERRSIMAERDALDRFTALYLADKTETTFPARISGISRYGLFVRLDETGADGIVPIRSLPRDYYKVDEKQQALIGERHKRFYQIGQSVQAKLEDADPLTSALGFSLVESREQPRKQARTRRRKN